MTDFPFIPLAIPNITEAEGANLQECIRSTFVSTVGPFVTQMEKRVAALCGGAHGVAMAAGTMALHMSLRALGVGRGDLVILPSFTFIASANAIAHAGARPWLIDISADSWTLDPDAVRRALEQHAEQRDGIWVHRETGERIAAVMPVYTLGTPADMEPLGEIARKYNLPIIADAAAAIGVEYKNKRLAEIADFTCFSFNGNKTVTSGGGGMVVGDNDNLMRRIRHISTTARVSRLYEHDEVGFNYRMTNLEAAVGCAQLDRLPSFLEAKRRIRATYDAAFAELPVADSFPQPSNRTSACWFSGLVLNDYAQINALEMCERLREKKIEARTFWKPVHQQVPYADAPCSDQSVTNDVWARIVTLPCSTQLTETDQARVINAVQNLLGA